MKLQTRLKILIIALPLGFTTTAIAKKMSETHSDSKGTITASVDGAIVLPTGDWADFTGLGVGVIGRGNYQLQDKLQVTGRVGYIFHLETGNTNSKTSEFLLLGGVRYRLGKIALDAATGLNFMTFKASGGFVTVSKTESRVPILLGVSYDIKPVEVGASFYITNLLLRKDYEKTLSGIMVTVGYPFM